MSNTATNVSAGKPKVGGAIFRAPIGTELPTSAVSELAEDFKDLGFVSEDGVSNSNSPSTEDIKEWGGSTVLTVSSGKEDTFSLKLIESLNIEVLKTVYGDGNVSGSLDTGIIVKSNSQDQEPSAWVIDMELRGGYIRRIVIPNGTIKELEEISYVGTDAIGYGITIGAALDSDENSHYEYTQKKTA